MAARGTRTTRIAAAVVAVLLLTCAGEAKNDTKVEDCLVMCGVEGLICAIKCGLTGTRPKCYRDCGSDDIGCVLTCLIPFKPPSPSPSPSPTPPPKPSPPPPKPSPPPHWPPTYHHFMD